MEMIVGFPLFGRGQTMDEIQKAERSLYHCPTVI